MNIRRQRIALVVATLLWSLSLTGCGDGGSKQPQSAAASTNPPTTAQPPSSGTAAPTTPAPANTPAPSAPAAAAGAATVHWSAPLSKTDGSALQNLAGFKIVYGTSAHSLDKSIRIDNPSIDQYVVEQLPAGKYYFGVRAYDETGAESELSNLMSKVIG